MTDSTVPAGLPSPQTGPKQPPEFLTSQDIGTGSTPGRARRRLGRAYRAGWVGTALLVAGIGGVVGLLADPVADVVGSAVAGGILACLAASLVARGAPTGSRVRVLSLAALIGASGCISLVGLVRLLGPMAVLLGALFAAASPPAFACCVSGVRRGWRMLAPPQVAPRTGRARPARTEPDPAYLLTDAELCLVWRTSFLELERTRDLDQQAALVDLRQDYLDELERRNPSGFARWLYAGARPASDPSRYLLVPHHQHDHDHEKNGAASP